MDAADVSQLGGPPTEVVAAVAEVIGEKIHWIADPVRAEDLARIVLRAATESGAVFLTVDERHALIEASAEAVSIVMRMNPDTRLKYMEMPWWSALKKLEAPEEAMSGTPERDAARHERDLERRPEDHARVLVSDSRRDWIKRAAKQIEREISRREGAIVIAADEIADIFEREAMTDA